MILAALSLAASAPSFDCAKAKTNVEKMICGDEQLAHLDSAVALDYLQMTRKERAEHRAWLKLLDACTNRACLLEQYERRVSDIILDKAPGVRHYYSRRNRGDLDVLPLGDGWYAFSVVGLWPTLGGSANFAEDGGSFHLNGTGATSRPPTQGGDCGWRVQRLSGDRWRMSSLPPKGSDISDCYGRNATINGIYSRSQRKPQ